MPRRTNWRGTKEWGESGLYFSTTSDEACKLYDAALTQYMGWYSDNSLGGIHGTLEKLKDADPNAVMGRVIALGLEVISTGRLPKVDPQFTDKVETLMQLARGPSVTEWEKLHAKAIKLLADGHAIAACNTWEDILLEYPTDMLAIRFAFDMYVYLGLMPQRRDSLARVLPHWKPKTPLYSYLHGLYSFGLCETNEFGKAEVMGIKALELNPEDTWATHALVHVYEMSGRYDDGIKLLNSTVKHWQPQESLACHNYWHWGVYNIEKRDYDGALNIFDSEICPRTVTGRSGFNVSDCSSLLRRLEMEGVSVGERWQDVYEVCKADLEDVDTGNMFPFSEVHYLMCCLGAKHKDVARKMMDSITEFIKDGETDNQQIKRKVGGPLCQSLLAYDDGEYDKAVDLLYPVRYDVWRIGGSNAQRDVFNQFLIEAAMKSPKPRHQKIAKVLLSERKASVEESTLTDRMIQRTLALH